MKKLKFRGVDSWGRPVFRCLENGRYYGNTNLIDANKVAVEDLEYFGIIFDCEPMGGDRLSSDDYELVKN